MEKKSRLPRNVYDWEKMVSSYDDDVSDIHNLEVIKSASKIHEGQFLLLRVLWEFGEAEISDFRKLVSASKYESACKFLDSLPSWASYVEDIRNQTSDAEAAFPDLSTFTLVRDHQLEAAQISVEADTSNVGFSPIASRTRGKARTQQGIQDSPLFGKGKEKDVEDFELSLENLNIGSPEESSPSTVFGVSPINSEAAAILYPAIRDEQIVNTALLLFLRAVSIHKLRNPCWTLHRRIFKVQFPKGKLEARTDGFLDLNVDGDSIAKAIIEVKPFVRASNT